jgi:hypothetical protein
MAAISSKHTGSKPQVCAQRCAISASICQRYDLGLVPEGREMALVHCGEARPDFSLLEAGRAVIQISWSGVGGKVQ